MYGSGWKYHDNDDSEDDSDDDDLFGSGGSDDDSDKTATDIFDGALEEYDGGSGSVSEDYLYDEYGERYGEGAFGDLESVNSNSTASGASSAESTT